MNTFGLIVFHEVAVVLVVFLLVRGFHINVNICSRTIICCIDKRPRKGKCQCTNYLVSHCCETELPASRKPTVGLRLAGSSVSPFLSHAGDIHLPPNKY